MWMKRFKSVNWQLAGRIKYQLAAERGRIEEWKEEQAVRSIQSRY